MTWAILHGGRPVFVGSYSAALDAAEEMQVLTQCWVNGGLDEFTRFVRRDFTMAPADMLPRRR
ncbi:hypothetical protein [Methylobacterium aquaticum]|uniref:Uncharacterized protein n=1 Tax=Methylobacterium aquaticum TaxID=270351 RepID=A0A0C6F7P6_9HYPH|nr:hypothetical protein [Methylobacterium aquaticum]BAQ44353.1 hypothetical protein Maq22A_c04715 [Methylobacterium aquaticum]